MRETELEIKFDDPLSKEKIRDSVHDECPFTVTPHFRRFFCEGPEENFRSETLQR